MDEKHQVIVHAEAFSCQDHENLAPRMVGAKKNMQAIGKGESYFEGRRLSADSNYHSYTSLALCKAEKLDAYIPDLQFRKRDERFAEQQRFKDGIHPRKRTKKPQARKEDTYTNADFLFDESKQAYLCPHGKVLKCNAHSHRIRHRVYDIYRARKRLDRFTLRTKSKVDVQWRLFALVHNIGKIHQYGLVN